MELKDLYRELLARPEVDPGQCVRHFTDLPSLTHIETSLRRTKPNKASGPDGIESSWIHYAAGAIGPHVYDAVLKLLTTMDEPIQWKGGMLYMLPKLGVIVRRIHALFRDPLMEQVAASSPPGQIGGFKHQECYERQPS